MDKAMTATQSLFYGDEELAFQLNRVTNLSTHIRIHVRPDAEIIVEAPHATPADEVHAAVAKRARWIVRHRQKSLANRAQVLKREYVSGETHFYLGRRHQLEVLEASKGEPSRVRLYRGKLELRLPVNDPSAVRRRLREWYKERAQAYLAVRTREIAINIAWVDSVPKVSLRSMAKQWGNCSPSGTITLNPALIKAPTHCVDYVIKHEICHLAEHNHSTKFYELLGRISPNWQADKSDLDGLAELLLAE